MKAGLVAACIVAVIAFKTIVAAAQDIVWVGEERFQAVNGTWFQLDDVDEQWKVIPGAIVVRFDSSIDSNLAPLALADLSLTLLSVRPDIGGYYRYSYDLSTSPPTISRQREVPLMSRAHTLTPS